MKEPFMRIGDLAKQANVLPSTIRHYTDLGLIEPVMDTNGGHHLYDPGAVIQRLTLIQGLSRRGKSLDEIKVEVMRRSRRLIVMLIEDDPEVSEFLAAALESIVSKTKSFDGADIETVADGFAAGRRCSETLPALMILDIMLPGLNGFKICRAVRSDQELSAIKILGITGYDTPENRKGILEAGANGYLAKPFGLEDLRTKLEEMGLI